MLVHMKSNWQLDSPRMGVIQPRDQALLYIADALALTIAPFIGAAAIHSQPARAGTIGLRSIVITIFASAAALQLHGLYKRPASRLRPSAWWRPSVVARCIPTATLLALGTDAVLAAGPRMTLTAGVAMTIPTIVLVPAGRRLLVGIVTPATVSRILLVGSGQIADRVSARLSRCRDIIVVGQVDDDSLVPLEVLGGLDDVAQLCRAHRVDRIIVAFSRSPAIQTLETLRKLDGQVAVSVVPRLFELHSWRCEVEELHGIPLVHIAPAQLGSLARAVKRVLDLTLAAIVLTLLLVPGLVVAALIKYDSPGPILFRQERVGRGGRRFQILKLRTMTVGAPAQKAQLLDASEVDGPLFKLHADPRVTPFGRFLRRASIDELPQLLNVLRGDMSLVGPRPLPIDESARLDGAALSRFDVAPGMTGLWQVSGRSDLSYADLQHLDSVYVQSWSLLWDLRIIWATPRSVLAGRGAY